MIQIEDSICISHWDKQARLLAARSNWPGGSSYPKPFLITLRVKGISILLHAYSVFVENPCAKNNTPLGRFQDFQALSTKSPKPFFTYEALKSNLIHPVYLKDFSIDHYHISFFKKNIGPISALFIPIQVISKNFEQAKDYISPCI